MRIEVIGGIASGKTTLAKLLTSSVGQVVYENFNANPFWAEFYIDPFRFAFETEVTFLLQHYNSLKKIIASKQHVVVSDFSIFQDLAYARVNLKGGEFSAFQAVYKETRQQLGFPDLLVHLECGPEEELKRIRARNRNEEATITVDYLGALNDSIAALVDEVRHEVDVLTIDSELLNFADNDAVREQLANKVMQRLSSANR